MYNGLATADQMNGFYPVPILYGGLVILILFNQNSIYFDHDHGKVVSHQGKQLADSKDFSLKGGFSIVQGDDHFIIITL